MCTTANKELVLTFCRDLSDRNLPKMFGVLAEDATWSWVGQAKTFAFAGTRSRQQAMALLGPLLGAFAAFRFDVHSSTAEANRVVIEATSRGAGPSGQSYANDYLMLFECRNGFITRISEFFDQLSVLAFAEAMAAGAASREPLRGPAD